MVTGVPLGTMDFRALPPLATRLVVPLKIVRGAAWPLILTTHVFANPEPETLNRKGLPCLATPATEYGLVENDHTGPGTEPQEEVADTFQ